MNHTSESKSNAIALNKPGYSRMDICELLGCYDFFQHMDSMATAFRCQPRFCGDDGSWEGHGYNLLEGVSEWTHENLRLIAEEAGRRDPNSNLRTQILADFVCTHGSEEIEDAIGSVINTMWGHV